ncbi:MAG TPA: protein kinase, partial [Polyangiaceae bacterium]|nr:protein kinase [Polyangiaceae bacterium]
MTSSSGLAAASVPGSPSPSAAEQPTLEAPSKGGAAGLPGLPTKFDDYALVQLLGRGSTGAVYLAEDRLLARHVAIKFIDAADVGDEARERFLNEARAVARVQHPNVIGIYRVGELEGRPYLVTE